MAKKKSAHANQVSELRRRNAELESDLATVRRSFLDFVRHAARLPLAGHGLGSLYSPELTDSIRQHIERVGDEAAWQDFKNSPAYRDAGDAWRILNFHFQDAFCASLADDVRRDLAERGGR